MSMTPHGSNMIYRDTTDLDPTYKTSMAAYRCA